MQNMCLYGGDTVKLDGRHSSRVAVGNDRRFMYESGPPKHARTRVVRWGTAVEYV
jgi:hypothetical protein